MQNIAAREAKIHFGELLDNAQREPITIEKHGRPVAVILSAHEYKALKIERLRTELSVGEAQANRGEFVEQSVEEIIEELKDERDDKYISSHAKSKS